jgi:hypothetical protein
MANTTSIIAPTDLQELPLDRFELLRRDGQEWRVLYFSFYHPRRSRNVPPGMLMGTWPRERHLQIMLRFPAMGTLSEVRDFPHGLPKAVEQCPVLGQVSPELGMRMSEVTARALAEVRSFARRPEGFDKL